MPLLESNCYEAFVNNIIGTRNLLEVAASYKVKRFVLISTDKAVEPTSVMGCSKRITELLVQEFAQNGATQQSPYAMATAVVRFGNVINSAGSVIPLFREQILAGGPVTVTHPDIERFFMSIREAVRLVLTAGTLGEWGELYILDMGKRIKMVDVANKMLALYGRRDIPIVFSGLRPGEKLTEDLTNTCETMVPTRFDKVRRVKSPALKAGSIEREVNKLESELVHLPDREIGERMFEMVARAQEAKRKLVAGV